MSQSTGELNIGITGQYIQPTKIDKTQQTNDSDTMFVQTNGNHRKVVSTIILGDIC